MSCIASVCCRGSHKLDCEPHLRFTCFTPRHVENAATVFPRRTRGIVHHTHTDTSAYINEQSTSDEAVTRWRFDVHTLNMKIPQWFSVFWSAAVPHCVLTARIWRDVSRITWSCRCTCPITLDRSAMQAQHIPNLNKFYTSWPVLSIQSINWWDPLHFFSV